MLGGVASGIAAVLDLIIQFIMILVLASVIISWVGADPNNPIVRIIHSLSEPIYKPIRKLTANLPGPIDWAPMIVILVLVFLQAGIVPYIRTLGHSQRTPATYSEPGYP